MENDEEIDYKKIYQELSDEIRNEYSENEGMGKEAKYRSVNDEFTAKTGKVIDGWHAITGKIKISDKK